jgi:hypothetical protein
MDRWRNWDILLRTFAAWVIVRRYEKGHFILISNLRLGQWSQTSANGATLAAAMSDRMLHCAHLVSIQGESVRLRDKQRGRLLTEAKSSRKGKHEPEICRQYKCHQTW